MQQMDVQAYLKRINYQGDVTPTLESLQQLHLAHLLSVPFENLDISLKRPIILNEAVLFDKIVTRRRGGFCYELNGLFAGLLRELGFDVTLLAAGVSNIAGSFSPIFDHLTLMVKLDERLLADVGFGDSFRQPLRLDSREAQSQNGHQYRLITDSDDINLIYQEQDEQSQWNNQYRFTLQGYQLTDYRDYCQYHQTSPESHFTQKRICTLATPDGRITLSDMRFITTKNGERQERMLDSQDEYNTILRERFGVEL